MNQTQNFQNSVLMLFIAIFALRMSLLKRQTKHKKSSPSTNCKKQLSQFLPVRSRM
jgi:hypothetical protein